MNTSPKAVDAITLFVEDLERSKLFYREIFGLPVFFEDENSAVFKFARSLQQSISSSREPSPAARPGRDSSSQSRWMTWMQRVPSWQPMAWSCSTAR